MAKYAIRADLEGEQNLQEWAKTWGEIQNEVQRTGGEVIDAYAVLGDYDFLFICDAEDDEAAMKIAVTVEQFGLDTKTQPLVEVDRLGELVDDLA